MNIEAKAGEVRGMDNEAMLDTAFLYGANAAYIEQLYAQYAEDPSSVPESWQRFFRGVGPRPGRRQGGARSRVAGASEAPERRIGLGA